MAGVKCRFNAVKPCWCASLTASLVPFLSHQVSGAGKRQWTEHLRLVGDGWACAARGRTHVSFCQSRYPTKTTRRFPDASLGLPERRRPWKRPQF
jgi:hypothetical protein